jgi:uncharacterized RDD family membrane protein YckC
MSPRASAVTFAGRAYTPHRRPFVLRRSLLEARALAGVIDALLLLAPALCAWLALAAAAQLSLARAAELVSGPALALALSYFFVCEARYGRTLGKRSLGLRVRTESGAPPSLAAVRARTLMRPVDAFCLLGLATALVTGARAGDWIGRTTVVFDAGIPLAPTCRVGWRLAAFPALTSASAGALILALSSL